MPKVILHLPAKGIEADYEVVTNPDGSTQVVIEPYFFNADAAAPVAYVQSVDDNEKTVSKAAVQVVGSNGNFKLSNVTKKVPPRFAGKKKPAATTEPEPKGAKS